ncbi:TPA: hypothetical protein NJJ38_003527 [Pseudomonas aeruginosa]|uniref:hypothetical protein n=1 Tax=Pseudomonas aeruginosa TaxID=287 RepID=UPI0003C36913|nr:hypothetical protein [Pseudomonas aeruginosa]ESR71435.1 hypothetical protein T266_09615 [Pseudomonas aeruginosa VRFPA05]EIU1336836.1 hypothetical protein [Pseudomonas aeruginosa]EIU5017301.1 hypothetical protein [Pseudomonas aeruginosa]EIZ7655298.1 hypothetical protein [Pseudomonas aeruginosa]EJV1368378.1 hypothetical protein [Pseudomonas aeruginosa]
MKAATQKHPLSNRTEQLLQQRGEYLEEIEQLEARVPGLETKLAELRKKVVHTTSHHIGNGNGSHEVMEDLSSTRARINALRGHVQEIERSLELVEKAESAAAAIAQAMELINTEQRLQASLQARIEQAATRSQGIEEEIVTAQSAAESAEQAAGHALAQAEDAKAEKAARTQLEKAVELALATEAIIRVKRRTIETMDGEVANMKQQAADSRQREQVAKAALSEALWSKYAEEWNAAAKTLASIGAHLVAADRINGGWGTHLTKLHIPLFGTLDRETLTRTEVVDASDEVSLDDLVKGTA